MSKPQRLPKGPDQVSESNTRWDVGRIVIENEAITVRDVLNLEDVATSERQERILTTEEVESLFASNAHHTFTEWCDIIHAQAEKRG